MIRVSTVHSLRLRYIIGLSVIALLVTASFITMQRVVSEQREFASLINLASHQAGLSNRIAYFGSLMVTTGEESEFNMAKAQVGRTINKMENAHHILRNGDAEKGIPNLTNGNLKTIYDDPMVGLEKALNNFLERARNIYESDIHTLHAGSAAYLYLTTYGPHVLEPLLDAAVEEYQRIGRQAILRIENLELAIWLATIATLLIELTFIFLPMEEQVRRTLTSLENSITNLKRTRKRLLAAQKMALVGDWELHTSTGHLTWSDQIFEICGVTKTDFSTTIDSTLELIHPEDRSFVRESLVTLIKERKSMDLEYRIMRPDGSERLVYQHAVANYSDSKDDVLVFGTIQDITERKELSARLEKLSAHIPGFIFQYHLGDGGRSRFPYVSDGIIDTCGIEAKAVNSDATPLFDLIHNEDLARVVSRINESSENVTTWHDQFRITHPLRGELWLEGHATPEKNGSRATLWYGYIWDITERKQHEQQIRKLALYDPLTGVANRRLLKDRMRHAIATCKRNRNYGAVIMLDLDNFKTLNDTKGHNFGDALLIEVARRLYSCVRDTDTIARLGGDEFVVVLEWLGTDGSAGKKKAIDVAEKIRVALSRTYLLGPNEHTHHASASIGVTTFHDNRKSDSELLKRADVAMYEAKDLGRNRVCFYTEARQAMVNRRTEMAHDLQIALDNEEFSLYYQPQISINGTLCGAEALIRWIPPGKKPISPGQFIPIAESTGLILPIGEWVLKKACQHINDLNRSDFPEHFAIAINISARQFSDDDFLNKVKGIINDSEVPMKRLKLELTETSLVQDINRAKVILNELREMGLKIELDDFGTGYSSLNSLKNLPLDTLKLDGSLIQGLDGSGSNEAIIRAVIAMAKAMSLDIIAEGVETPEQRQFLIDEGCEMLQGYLFAKPMPFQDFMRYLQAYNSSAFSTFLSVPAAVGHGYEDILV